MSAYRPVQTKRRRSSSASSSIRSNGLLEPLETETDAPKPGSLQSLLSTTVVAGDVAAGATAVPAGSVSARNGASRPQNTKPVVSSIPIAPISANKKPTSLQGLYMSFIEPYMPFFPDGFFEEHSEQYLMSDNLFKSAMNLFEPDAANFKRSASLKLARAILGEKITLKTVFAALLVPFKIDDIALCRTIFIQAYSIISADQLDPMLKKRLSMCLYISESWAYFVKDAEPEFSTKLEGQLGKSPVTEGAPFSDSEAYTGIRMTDAFSEQNYSWFRLEYLYIQARLLGRLRILGKSSSMSQKLLWELELLNSPLKLPVSLLYASHTLSPRPAMFHNLCFSVLFQYYYMQNFGNVKLGIMPLNGLLKIISQSAEGLAIGLLDRFPDVLTWNIGSYALKLALKNLARLWEDQQNEDIAYCIYIFKKRLESFCALGFDPELISSRDPEAEGQEVSDFTVPPLNTKSSILPADITSLARDLPELPPSEQEISPRLADPHSSFWIFRDVRVMAISALLEMM